MQIQENQFELKKNTVKKAVRICINCGNIAVSIQNRGMFCKDCGTFFDVEEEDE